MNRAIAFTLALIVLGGCKKKETESGVLKEEEPGLLQQATVSDDSARRVALAQVPGGRITKAELEREDGALIYSYDIKVGNEKGATEVHVDAKTGAVVRTAEEQY